MNVGELREILERYDDSDIVVVKGAHFGYDELRMIRKTLLNITGFPPGDTRTPKYMET